MAHKYIKEIIDLDKTPYGWSENTGRDSMWREQRRIYGFDERETWSLDTTFFHWLYERVKMYDEVNIVDTNSDFNKIQFKGEELTLQNCIDLLLDNCKTIILSEGMDNSIINIEHDVMDLWKECYSFLWW